MKRRALFLAIACATSNLCSAANSSAPLELAYSADAISASSIPTPDGINSSGTFALVSRREVPAQPALFFGDGGPLESASALFSEAFFSPLLAPPNPSPARLAGFANRYFFDPGLTPNGAFLPEYLHDFGELDRANAVVTGVAGTDPFLASSVHVTNPFSQAITYRFEASVEIDPLEAATLVGDAIFSAEVFDTGGDAGAELDFFIGHTARQDGQHTSLNLDHSGSVQPGAASVLEVDQRDLAAFGEPFDELLSSMFLTLSPGDTAEVRVIASLGDAATPLWELDAINASLAQTTAFARSFDVPSPAAGSLAMVVMSLVGLAARRPQEGASTR